MLCWNFRNGPRSEPESLGSTLRRAYQVNALYHAMLYQSEYSSVEAADDCLLLLLLLLLHYVFFKFKRGREQKNVVITRSCPKSEAE